MWTRYIAIGSLTVSMIGLAPPAIAQRTDDNATASAEDAFGKSVGDSSIGIYSEVDVRGFSPTEAGNLRIEGLYYDQQGTLANPLLDSTTVRVGISAQSYLFPAPTGIADFALQKAGADPMASAAVTFGPRNAIFTALDLKIPIDADRLGIAAGINYDRDRRAYGGTPKVFGAGATIRYAPQPSLELIGFGSYYQYRDGEAQPLIYSSGNFLPKRFRRGRFLGQSWNDYSATAPTFGMIGRAEVGGFDLKFGLFRSIFENEASTADLLLNTDLTGRVGQRIVVVQRDDRYASTSGEFRVSRAFNEGPRAHRLTASVRARTVGRRYGGAALIDLRESRSDAPDPRPEPETTDGPKSRDRIDQQTLGLAYQAKWLDVGEVSLGVQRTRYRKQVTDPDPTVTFPESRDSPWLPTATAAVYLNPRLALYGGFTRGLEESAAAPIEAVNRSDAPPAIRTRQVDGGIRWLVSPGLSAVAGLFRISKPYFNLDPAKRFRQLGTITNQGAEVSLAGQLAPGLNIVAGMILLDAKISGEEVKLGLIGERPVGSFVRRSLLSVDYRPPAYDRLSVDLVVDSSSKRIANAANDLAVPPRTIVSVGGRYRFTVGKSKALIRAQVQNLTNKFGWNVGRSGYFTPIAERSFSIGLAADF
ncbi:MAG TPA: TonB-dependent receptor [Sphingomicrobium sp.]